MELYAISFFLFRFLPGNHITPKLVDDFEFVALYDPVSYVFLEVLGVRPLEDFPPATKKEGPLVELESLGAGAPNVLDLLAVEPKVLVLLGVELKLLVLLMDDPKLLVLLAEELRLVDLLPVDPNVDLLPDEPKPADFPLEPFVKKLAPPFAVEPVDFFDIGARLSPEK